jgi:subtilisin family serine protease
MTKFTAFWSSAIFIAVCTFSVDAAERWATIDGKEAHPSQVLAKIKEGSRADRVSLNRLLGENDLVIATEFKLVPGLVLLSKANNSNTLHSLPNYGGKSTDPISSNLGALIDILDASELFEYVQPDYVSKITADAQDASYQDDTLWGLRNRGLSTDGTPFGVIDADIDANLAWDVTTGSRDVIVGVIDTGVWYTHNDLKSQMWTNPGEIPNNGLDDDENGWIDDVFGINTVVDSGDPLDDEGHGTHVSGIIGASANDSGDVVGVAWEVQIMALKAFDSFGFSVDSDQIQAIEYGVTHGCRIINASFGGPSFSQSVFDMIQEAQNQNVLVVASAGNEGRDADLFPLYPGSYNLDNVISVASMNRFDQLSDFSNFGLNNVDIAAPGEGIYSTNNDGDDTYEERDGTSQAAPYVAGVGALVLSVFPELSVGELRGRILSSSVKTPAYSGKVATGGRVNAFGAFDASPDGSLEVTLTPPSQSAVVVGESLTLVARISDLFAVTDAVVEGIFPDGSTVSFTNDGEAPDVQGGDALYTADIPVPGETGELSFVLKASAAGKEGIESVVRYLIVDRPENDDFGSSIKLSTRGASFVTNTRFATLQANEPEHGNVFGGDKSLWWTWTPSSDNIAFIDTSGSDFDTVIAVYTGNSLNGLEPVASINNIGAKLDAFLTFPAQRGVGYRISISGANADASGTLRMRLTPNGQPDLVAPVVAIDTPLSGTVSLGNLIEVTGTAFDPNPNGSGVSQVLIRINNETIGRLADGTTRWAATASLVPGQNTIQAVVRDFSGNIAFSPAVRVNFFIADPANDHFANAEVLDGVSGEVLGNSRSATKQFGEPLHAGNLGGRSLWYSFTPSEDGELDLLTRGSNFDTLLSVYNGEKVTALDLIGANDDMVPGTGVSRVTIAVKTGVKYSIAVDGFSDQNGRVIMRYEFTAGGIFNVAVASSEGGQVNPGSGLQSAGADVIYLAEPVANFAFVGWQGSVDSTDNPLSVTVDQDLELNAIFAPVAIADDFESGSLADLGYQFNGSQPWSVTDRVASAGGFAARSGVIGDSQSSSLILNSTFSGGRGSFDYGVSSEEGWDFLEFYINGDLKAQWSGEIDWQSFEFSVPAGAAELEWRYTKDFANSAGLDGGFIDNLDLPIGEPEVAGTQLSVTPFGERGIKLSIAGDANAEYVVESTMDLISWSEFTRGTAGPDGILRFGDSDSEGTELRFFRAVRR